MKHTLYTHSSDRGHSCGNKRAVTSSREASLHPASLRRTRRRLLSPAAARSWQLHPLCSFLRHLYKKKNWASGTSSSFFLSPELILFSVWHSVWVGLVFSDRGHRKQWEGSARCVGFTFYLSSRGSFYILYICITAARTHSQTSRTHHDSKKNKTPRPGRTSRSCFLRIPLTDVQKFSKKWFFFV